MTRLRLLRGIQIRWFSTEGKMKVIASLDEQLQEEQLKHRKHPGIMKPRTITYPTWILEPFRKILHEEKLQQKTVYMDGQKLAAHLKNRHPLIENDKLQDKITKVRGILEEKGIDVGNDENVMKNRIAKRILSQHVYNWAPIKYDKYTCLSYFVGRGMAEYSALVKVLNEIMYYDPEFKPQTLFDFGSGIGTVLWVASQMWSDSLKEYFCVDISSEMNDLSEDILKRAVPPIKNVFHRQFFAASPTPSYDIVVSAYSLFELPDTKSRIEAIGRLWRKTNNYLVIVEHGTNAGFKLVKDARDFVLNYIERRTSERITAHVVAPCPHDSKCPRYATDDTPCNFEINYYSLPISVPSQVMRERYSYVILKKGERLETDQQWPRIVRPPLRRSSHVVCRMCTASGKLEEEIFTKYKNGRNTYRCARCSEWGDRLPFEIQKAE